MTQADGNVSVKHAVAAPDPRRWWTLAVLCLSLLVVGIDNSILNVAIPTLVRELDVSTSQLHLSELLLDEVVVDDRELGMSLD